MEKFHIAIDGPAGSGKTTVAKALAERLGFDYLDTGAMYRAVALFLSGLKVREDDDKEIDRVLSKVFFDYESGKLYINGKEIGEEIRSAEAGMLASKYARNAVVRRYLVKFQREIADDRKIVVEGRDIGTVVLPDADLKIFLKASIEERAKRRYKELVEKGEKVTYEEILRQLKKRDEQDSGREISPLKPADDAIVIDTTNMSIQEVVDEIVRLYMERVR